MPAAGATSWADDPVRLYLDQIARVPLLSREKEISLARTIEQSRRRFRRGLLESGTALRAAVELLRRVHEGSLTFDRTVQVAVSDELRKEQILARLPQHLRTLQALLERNANDYRIVARRGAASRRFPQRL